MSGTLVESGSSNPKFKDTDTDHPDQRDPASDATVNQKLHTKGVVYILQSVNAYLLV
jgi:hypothetical protein